jgi:hypothetical protein
MRLAAGANSLKTQQEKTEKTEAEMDVFSVVSCSKNGAKVSGAANERE